MNAQNDSINFSVESTIETADEKFIAVEKTIQHDIFEGLGKDAKDLPPSCKCYTMSEVEQIVSRALLNNSKKTPYKVVPDFPNMDKMEIDLVLDSCYKLQDFYCLYKGTLALLKNNNSSFGMDAEKLGEVVRTFETIFTMFDKQLSEVCCNVHK